MIIDTSISGSAGALTQASVIFDMCLFVFSQPDSDQTTIALRKQF
jgi:hypothetical protein